MRMPSLTDPSEYVLELLREGPDFILYRGRQHGNPSPVLALALAAEQPSPQSLRRLEHEYSLATELDAAWAAQPLALTRHQGRAVQDRLLGRDVDYTSSHLADGCSYSKTHTLGNRRVEPPRV